MAHQQDKNDTDARVPLDPLVSVSVREYTETVPVQKPVIGHGNMFFCICCPVCKEQFTLLEGTKQIPPHDCFAR